MHGKGIVLNEGGQELAVWSGRDPIGSIGGMKREVVLKEEG